MLQLVQSNKMEVLVKQLTVLLGQYYASGNVPIFSQQAILVQSPGMAQWLQIQIADALGIAANLEFPLPSSYIWKAYQAFLPEVPAESAFTKSNLAWKIMTLLPTLLDDEDFASIRDYLALPDNQQLRLYQLSQKIADLFDQYLVYRPDWIIAWEEGDQQIPQESIAQQPWQPKLWQGLKNLTESLQESPWHRANMHQSLLTRLSQQPQSDEPLFIFGISALPVQQLEVFSRLAQHRPVYLFWFNPSEHYWADLVDARYLAKQQLMQLEQGQSLEQNTLFTGYDMGHPLLASWGKLGADFQELLIEQGAEQLDCFVEPEANTLLSYLQQGIFYLDPHLGEEESSKISIAPQDDSLHFSLCHSKLRELEILHDHLMAQLQQDPDLSLADIIVMTPDISEYAPYVEAVFGAASDELYLDYAISDKRIADQAPLLQSFLQILSLHNSRFTLSELLEWFATPQVLRRYDVSLEAFEQLSLWLQDSGVRWGQDAQDKQRWDLPQEGQNTWYFGVQRLLAGYAMQPQDSLHCNDHQVAPLATVEGNEVEVLGKFLAFYRRLQRSLRFCQQAHPLQEKVDFARELLSDLYAEGIEDSFYFVKLNQALDSVAAHQTQFPEPVEQDVFVAELQQLLNESGVGQRFLAGRINFCTLMPMRSIPFKVICLLGMNDTDYPRQVTPVGFDLMRQSPARRGDRARRLDDRYLFLEALLSARQQLYLSYQGFSLKDNSHQPASILVTELQEHIKRHFCLAGTGDESDNGDSLIANLTQKHPLQPFHQRYFEPGHPRSYQRVWRDALLAQQQQHEPPFAPLKAPEFDYIEASEIPTGDLFRFYRHPLRSFFKSHWQTQFEPPTAHQEDSEPLAFDGLQQYQLLNRFLQRGDQTAVAEQAKLEGELRVGNLYQIDVHDVAQSTVQITTPMQQHFGADWREQRRHLDVYCSIEEARLYGRIDAIYGDHLVLLRPGKLRAIDQIQLWLQWLLLCSANSGLKEAWLLAKDKQLQWSPLNPAQAQAELKHWVAAYQYGQHQPLLFFPETSWNWVKNQDPDKAVNSYLGSANIRGEGQDPHNKRVLPDLTQGFDAFALTADTLLGQCPAVRGR